MADVQLLSIKESLEGSREDVTSALNKLNTLLDYSTRTEITKATSVIPVEVLFDLLSSSDEELVATCCAALEKIFRVLEAQDICQYRGHIELGLQHPFEEVRQTCLDTLMVHSSDPRVQQMVNTSTVFHLVTQTVGDPSLKCANMASNILFNMATVDKCNTDVLAAELKGVMHKDSTVRCRVYELAVKISASNDTHLASLTSILAGLVQELQGDDVLVQLNCIELLILLMGSHGGLRFLENHKVTAKLHSMLTTDQNPFGMMVIPGKYACLLFLTRYWYTVHALCPLAHNTCTPCLHISLHILRCREVLWTPKLSSRSGCWVAVLTVSQVFAHGAGSCPPS